MKKGPDGGAAFPRAMIGIDVRGMSLRDYFAGQALAGLAGVAMQATVDRIIALIDGAEPSDTDGENWRSMRVTAEVAYQFADAMIDVRNNHPEPSAEIA